MDQEISSHHVFDSLARREFFAAKRELREGQREKTRYTREAPFCFRATVKILIFLMQVKHLETARARTYETDYGMKGSLSLCAARLRMYLYSEGEGIKGMGF